MTGSTRKRDSHGGADPYSKLSQAQERRKMTYPLVIGGTVLVVAVCALVAFLATRSGDDGGSSAASGTGAAAAANAEQQTADITVSGEPLPEMPETTGHFTDPATDRAIGLAAPSIEGESFDGSTITIDPADGTPRVIVFVAHWCPHCQKEVPEIQQWIDDGNLPEGVEIVYVSTSVNEGQGNYPVSDWIVEEGVTPQVVLDDENSGAAAKYGLAGFPYFVMIDGEGKVVARGSGEIPMDVFGPAVDALAAGQDPVAAAG